MIPSLVTAPGSEPLSIAEAKQWIRQDSDDHDALIAGLITACRQAVEAYLGRALITQTWDLLLDRFCNVELPMAPLQSVTSITYTDTAGASQTLSTSVYDVFTYDEHPGWVRLAYDQSWPSTRIVSDAVAIRYVAGFGDAANNVPAAIRNGIKLMVGEYYKNAELTVVGPQVMEIPKHIERMLWSYRVLGF